MNSIVSKRQYGGRMQGGITTPEQCAAALDMLFTAYKTNGRMDQPLAPHYRFEVEPRADGRLRVYSRMRASSSQSGDYGFFMGQISSTLPGQQTLNTFAPSVEELAVAIQTFARRYSGVNNDIVAQRLAEIAKPAEPAIKGRG